MEKVYDIIGIDCPVCASKLEGKINKVKGVEEAFINFLASKLIVEYKKSDYKNFEDEVIGVVKKFDSDIEVNEVN